MDDIVLATAKAMVAEGIPFRGVLFAGLMIKNGKVSHITSAGLGLGWECVRCFDRCTQHLYKHVPGFRGRAAQAVVQHAVCLAVQTLWCCCAVLCCVCWPAACLHYKRTGQAVGTQRAVW